MPSRRRLPLSRNRLLLQFLAITLIPVLLLVALGWRLFDLDRQGALTRLEERRKHTAEAIVTELEQDLSTTTVRLADPGQRSTLVDGDDAAVVVFSGNVVSLMPPARLAYLPAPPVLPEADPAEFAEGERLEYRENNATAAAAWFQSRATSREPAIRAGALVRRARNLRNSKQTDAALGVYADVASIKGVAVAGVPADLLARIARCDLLASARRSAQLQQEATALVDDLRAGTWPISNAVYDANITDLQRWANRSPTDVRTATELLARSTANLWQRWISGSLSGDASPRSGHEVDGEGKVTTIWVRRDDELVALVATYGYVERQWLRRLQPLLDLQRARLTLGPSSITTAPGPRDTRRVASETNLPWTFVMTSGNEAAELGELADRRQLWLAGLVLLIVLLLSGTAMTARAVTRELAAARLQADFVSAVSHEFRTPLTTMRQLTEVLKEERVPSESRRRTYYAALERQTDRLQRLVESLLDFGRLEAGASPYRMERVEVLNVVCQIARDYTAEAETRGVEVDVQISGDEVDVLADRDALSNVLWNLIDNAVKYSPEHHVVWISVESGGSGATIRVRDRGIGIPQDEQPRIFDKFVRGSRAVSDRIAGTGIGLAIVRHVVRAHGGTVAVESEPGSGSTFSVSLP